MRGEQDIGQNGRREVCTKGERTNGLPGFLYASRTKWLPECCTHRTEWPPESLYKKTGCTSQSPSPKSKRGAHLVIARPLCRRRADRHNFVQLDPGQPRPAGASAVQHHRQLGIKICDLFTFLIKTPSCNSIFSNMK